MNFLFTAILNFLYIRLKAEVCIVPLFLIMAILVLMTFRISITQWQLPVFTVMDNPASFSASKLTRLLTFSYHGFFSFWLLLCPSGLCFDWSMESIPLLNSLTDIKNTYTISLFFLLAAVGKLCELLPITITLICVIV